MTFDKTGLAFFAHKILQCRFRRARDRRTFALMGLAISKRTDEDDMLEERDRSDYSFGIYARDMGVWEGLVAGYRCVRCQSSFLPMIGRSNTAYFAQISNWHLLCGDCWVQDDELWEAHGLNTGRRFCEFLRNRV